MPGPFSTRNDNSESTEYIHVFSTPRADKRKEVLRAVPVGAGAEAVLE